MITAIEQMKLEEHVDDLPIRIMDLKQIKYITDPPSQKPPKKSLHFCPRNHINFGYRVTTNNSTISKCTSTIIQCHCETTNIWSHLLATMYFIL